MNESGIMTLPDLQRPCRRPPPMAPLQYRAVLTSAFAQGAMFARPYFVLSVRRSHLVEDTLVGITSVPDPATLKLPLKVTFVGEEVRGGEARRRPRERRGGGGGTWWGRTLVGLGGVQPYAAAAGERGR